MHKLPYDFKKYSSYKNYEMFEWFGKECHLFSYDNVIPSIMTDEFKIYF